MTPEERDEKLIELEDKLDEIAQKIEDAEFEGNDELVEISEEYIEVSTTNPVKKQVVHFISIDETQSFEGDCSNIKDSKDAEKAFSEASDYRDSGDKRSFEHGNVLILECQGEKESESESSSAPVPDGCYYIGICSIVETHHQEADPFSLLESQEAGGEPVKNFIAWHTCSSKSDVLAFEDPDPISSTDFCNGTIIEGGTEESTGIKLDFDEDKTNDYNGNEFSGKKAFIPLIPQDECPVTEELVIREIDFNGSATVTEGVCTGASSGSTFNVGGTTPTASDSGNVSFGTKQINVKLPLVDRKLIFKGGLLMRSEDPVAPDTAVFKTITFNVPCVIGGDSSSGGGSGGDNGDDTGDDDNTNGDNGNHDDGLTHDELAG